MNPDFITLDRENIAREHICCGFSDKKSVEGTALKKAWLTHEFDKGYLFRRLNERAKVFLEYGPAEEAWVPVEAPNYLMLGCFWVSGQYKGQGYGKALLQSAIEDAKRQGKNGLVTIVGIPKKHFLSDPKWLMRQGFVEADRLSTGFVLLVLKLRPEAPDPRFSEVARSGECPDKDGLVAYYSSRCPFTEYYVCGELAVTADVRGIPLKIIKLETLEQARICPSPATIFSLFHNGKYLTNDLSACLENRFGKVVQQVSE